MPLKLTPAAVAKVKEIIEQQDPKPTGLRIGVRGGGCSGFSYAFQFLEGEPGEMDFVEEVDGLRVVVDSISAMYLDGCEVDYVERLDGVGFKFNNPNVKSTCGCGQSFDA